MNVNKQNIIIVSPTLDPENVSGVSAITRFIIKNNPLVNYIHFELGKRNGQRGGLFRVVRIGYSLKQWIQFLKGKNGSIIHYNFPITRKSALRDPIFMTIARLFSCKLVIHLHGGNYLERNKTPIWVSWILNRVFSMNYPVIVQSPDEKSVLERKFKAQNVYSIPNCVDLDGTEGFERTKLTDAPLTILYMGRIVETKGINYIFQSFKTLKEKGVPFKLIFAGEEEVKNQYIDKFKNCFGDQFSFEGIVLGKEKEDLLKKSDVFLLPSFYEGLPLSLIESMSFGLTPVVTNVGSISYCVEDNHNGLIVKDHDYIDIAKAIECLHYDRDKLFNMGIKSMEIVKKLFDPQKYIHDLNTIYSSLN